MNTKGFTIIETLVAIAVIMLAIVGPLTIANKGLVAAVSARDQITANYLAQDAMEYLKNIRDNNLLQNETTPGSVEWMYRINNLGDCDASLGKFCKIETSRFGSSPIASASSADFGRLYYNSSNKTYTHEASGNEPTPFYRYYQVSMKNTTIDYDDARVEVVVIWKVGTVTNKVSVKNNFYRVLR